MCERLAERVSRGRVSGSSSQSQSLGTGRGLGTGATELLSGEFR